MLKETDKPLQKYLDKSRILVVASLLLFKMNLA